LQELAFAKIDLIWRTLASSQPINPKKFGELNEKTKDAGIIYESFRIKMNRVIWDFWPYKSNPRYKSFEKRSVNQIRDMNL
jgi:hypothetical protein